MSHNISTLHLSNLVASTK